MGETVLIRRGDQTPGAAFGLPCHRIPALAVTDSSLVVVWDVREDWRDLPGAFDLVLTASNDGGVTWESPRILRAHDQSGGFGDASLTWDPVRGRLLCWYVGSGGRSFFTADAGAQGAGLSLWCATSDDAGLTWRHREHTASLKPADVTGMFAASGNGICLVQGRWAGRCVQPMVMRDVDGRHWATMALSDDGGESWRLGARLGPDCDENKVVELENGRLLLQARSTPRRRQAYSDDGGETFSAPQPHPALTDPGCNGGLARLGEDLVCSLLDDETRRRRLVVRHSRDHGATWSAGVVVDEGAAAYSVVAAALDGSLLIVWESGDYDALRFRRLTRGELGLDGAAPTLVPRRDDGVVARDPEVAPDRDVSRGVR